MGPTKEGGDDSRGRRLPHRRTVLTSVTGVGVTALAGCIGDLGDDDDEVRFGLTPAEGDVDTSEQWGALFDHLEEETGATIDATELENYSAILDALRNDQLDISGVPHTIAIFGDEMDATDIVGLRKAFGTDREFAFITTHPDDDIQDISELDDTAISFADPLSTPGSLFPLAMLADGGLDIGTAPDGEPAGFQARYSDHATAREELLAQDEVKAAGTGSFSVIAHVPGEQIPEQVHEMDPGAEAAGTEDPALDLLAVSEPIPRPPIIARREWDAPERTAIEEALLEAPPEAYVDPDAEFPLWFDGVVEGEIEEYDPVREVMERVSIDLDSYE